MHSVHYDVHKRGGIAKTHELLRDGHTSHRLTRAVRADEVIRVRQGHYACPELAAEQVRAYRVGGRLAGIAGAAAHGIWTPRSSALDVQVVPDARALRTASDPHHRLAHFPDGVTRVAWNDRGEPGTRSLAGPATCVATAVRRLPRREAFAVVESARHKKLLSASELQRILSLSGLDGVGDRSESGAESLLRFDMLDRGWNHRQQVEIARVGRVDFLLGTSLIIEVDGGSFHSDADAFERDRRRDAVASVQGYRTLRFSARQLERGDPVVAAAISAALARGDHR